MDKKEYKKYIGEFKNIYIAHSTNKQIREKSASGGAVTSLLKYLLDNKIIDKVITIGFDKEYPYKYKVLKISNSKELTKTIGSKYIKIPLNEILNLVNKKEKTAIVGLPCVVNPLAKLRKQDRYKNIVFTIGLFCGWGFDSRATDYLIKQAGVNKNEIKSIDYRGGEYPGGFSIETKEGRAIKFKKYHYDIVNILFSPQSCVNCNFYTSEYADISVGDAWFKNKKNQSTVIVRTKIGKSIFDKAIKKDYLKAEIVKPELVIKSHWHNIKHKKIGDSLILKFILKILNTDIVRILAPFRLLTFLVKTRRRLMNKE